MRGISIHALREEGDAQNAEKARQRLISIHALREEGDPPCGSTGCRHGYFYPRPPRGGRRQSGRPERPSRPFLSTPSARRATQSRPAFDNISLYFYPRPPRGGRLCQSVEPHFSLYVYPRPPRGGRHRGGQERALAILNFYPRPPRGGRPQACWEKTLADSNFYPRPPRGGRPDSNYKSYGAKDFYPRPPRGGRPSGDRAYALTESISIHALREEGDL